jgi:hypothetical protein
MSEQFNPYSPVKPNTDEKFIFPSIYLSPLNSEGYPEDENLYINFEQNEADIERLGKNIVFDTSPIYTQAELDKEVLRQTAVIRAELEAQIKYDVQNQVDKYLKPENLINEAKNTAKNKLKSWANNAKNFLQNDAARTKQDVSNLWGGLLGGAKKLLNVSVDTGGQVAKAGANTALNIGSVAANKAQETYQQAKQAASPLAEKVREVSFNLANNSYDVLGGGERAIEQYSRLNEQLNGSIEGYLELQNKHTEVLESIKAVVMQGLGKQEHRDELDLLNAALTEINHQINSIQEGAAAIMFKIDALNISQVIKKITDLHDTIETQNPGYLYAEGLSSKLSLLEQKCYAIIKKYNEYPELPNGLNAQTNEYYKVGGRSTTVVPPTEIPAQPLHTPSASQLESPQKNLTEERIKRIITLKPEELQFELKLGNISSVILALKNYGTMMDNEQLKTISVFLEQLDWKNHNQARELAMTLVCIPQQQDVSNYYRVYTKTQDIKFWEEVLLQENVFKFIPESIVKQIAKQATKTVHDSNEVVVIDKLLELLRNTDVLTEGEKAGLYNKTQESNNESKTQSVISSVGIDDLLVEPVTFDTSLANNQTKETKVENTALNDKIADMLKSTPKEFSTFLSPTYHEVIPVIIKENPEYFSEDMLIKLLDYSSKKDIPIPFTIEVATLCLELLAMDKGSEKFYECVAKFVREVYTEQHYDLKTIVEAIAVLTASFSVMNNTIVHHIYHANIPQATIAMLQNPKTILENSMHNGLENELDPVVKEAYKQYLSTHSVYQKNDSNFTFDEPFQETVLKAESQNETIIFNKESGSVEARSEVVYKPVLEINDSLYIDFDVNQFYVLRKTESGIFLNKNLIVSKEPEKLLNQVYTLQPDQHYPKITIVVAEGSISEISVDRSDDNELIKFEII